MEAFPRAPKSDSTSPLTGWRPWRSRTLGVVVAVVALLVSVPPFLCMPPWNDVTLHDMAARNILKGGVHYRGIFDTNLPGIDWAMAVIRATCGWSYEVLRACDLVVIGLAVILLAGWLKKCSAGPVAVAWFLAAAALFYPFTSEFSHCQRDPWMLLPAVLAARLRLRQVEIATSGTISLLGRAILEGIAWGLAVWIKPHVLVPAAGVWLASALLIVRDYGWRRAAVDFLGMIVGGGLAGIAGVLWLIGTGAWPEFIEVFTRWNPEYTAQTWKDLPVRLREFHDFFRPWGYLHFVAIPVAVWSLWRIRSSERANAARALLAAFYLAWLGQAIILQRGFDYVRIPDTLLALAIAASTRWVSGFVLLVWGFAFVALCSVQPVVLTMWPRCWTDGSTPEVRDRLGHYVDVHCGTKWAELNDVAGFLRTIQPPLRDRELNCWHDSTHPLYLMLDLDPATRYMHYGTVFPITSQSDRIRQEVADSPQRFVVSDLRRMSYKLSDAYAPGADGVHSLPSWFPVSQRDKYPWNQPIVYRSGRYLVHEITHKPQPEEIDIPEWLELDQLGPGLELP